MSKYFKCTTNKNPLEYTCGEKIIFSIRAKNSGNDVECNYIKWILQGDDGKKSEGFGSFKQDKPLIIETTLDCAGFVRLTCTAYLASFVPDPSFEVLNVSAGADVDNLCYLDTVPDDFDDYWAELKNTVDYFDCKLISSTPNTSGVPDGIKCYDIRISTPWGRPASGYLSIPEKAGKLPLAVYFVGYTIVGAWPVFDSNAISLCLNAHGIENGVCRADLEIKYNDELRDYGFSEKENASNMTTYWRSVMLRDLIGLKYAKSLSDWDGENLTVSGGSQGAFQATLMASCDKDVSFLDIYVPWFCNMRAEQFGFMKGSRPNFAEGLRYFDTVAHAARVRCPVRMRIGLGDYICPPSTTMALYNTFKTPKTLQVRQGVDHPFYDIPEEERFYKSYFPENPSGEVRLGRYRHFKGNEYEVLEAHMTAKPVRKWLFTKNFMAMVRCG